MSQKPTARDTARAAAAANGWTLKEEELFIDDFKKGGRYVRVLLDTSGRITFASTPKEYIYGKDKLARVLERLAK
jgi:hypothetical protein